MRFGEALGLSKSIILSPNNISKELLKSAYSNKLKTAYWALRPNSFIKVSEEQLIGRFTLPLKN